VAHCINRNHQDFIKLEKETGINPDILAAKIAIFQQKTGNLELFPTKEEILVVEINKQNKQIDSEVDKISKEITDSIDKTEIVKNVDEYFDVISKHLRNLRERKSYERLRKMFTTPENINKLSTLQGILDQAQKSQDDIEGDRRKIRSLAQSIVQIDHLTDLALEDVRQIIKNKDDSVENLSTLQSYLNTINDWEILLETANQSFAIGNPTTTKTIGKVKLKIKQIESLIAKNDESGVVKTLQDILIPASKDMIKVLNKELNQLNQKLQRQEDRKADEKTLKDTKASIKAIADKIQSINFEESQNVIDFLKGKRGDASMFNSLLESFRDSTDPTISAFSTFVKNTIDEVANKSYKEDLQYQKELAPHITDAERRNPASLSEKITFQDRVLKDGEDTKVITLLNPWENYRFDYQTKQDKEQKAKLKYSETKLEEDKLAYLEAKKDRQKFEQDVLFQEYLPEVYEKYKLFDDEIGQELKEESDRIFNRIAELDADYNLRGIELTPQQELEKEDLLLQYKMLGNLNKPDGSPKTGRDLDKAKRMQEIRTLNRKFFEWKDNANMFEKAKERHSEYIISTGIAEDSQEYRDSMQKWEQENTRMIIKDSFYKKREAITKEINYLTKKFKDETLQDSIKDLWDTIQSITYGLRDEDGQPIGILVQQKGAERIKDAQEALQTLQDKVTQISGLTKEEQSLLNDLFDKSKSGVITQEEREDLSNLLAKSKAEGLSKTDKERLFKLFAELKNLQSNVPTEYYIQATNNLTTKYGVTVLDNGEVIENTASGTKVVPFLESSKLDELLEHKDFKKWFDLNHIQVEKFNSETKQIEQKWQRTYQWNRIIPNDEQYVDIKPSLKYSYRQIKPEFKTERIEGKTVDNRGNWLPDPSKTGSNKYRNEKYYNLINAKDAESKRLSTILDIHKKHLLTTQEDLSRNFKLYLDVPRVEREGAERNISFLKEALENPGDISKLIWNRIKEAYRDATNFDVSDERYESPFEGKYDKDFIKIPMKYTGNVDADKVSLDLFRSISKYNYASNLNKKLVETLPVARALTRVLDKNEEHKTAKNKNSTRIEAIRKIILANYEGQKSNLDLKKLGAAEKPVTAAIHLAKYLASWATIKINIPAAIANVVNAEFQNIVNLANELYTPKSYASAKGLLATRFTPAFLNDYAKNKLGEVSLESQMADVFEPVQGETLQEIIGEKSKQSKIFDFLALNPLFNLRNWGEFEVQSSNWLAAMIETKVDYGQDVISLVDAYELDEDGIIKLKDGIDKSWEVGGQNFQRFKAKVQAINRKIHGNYASYDKTQAEMYALGSLAMFLKRFFISMAANRFAYGDNIHEGRFNINTSEYQHGYYTNTLSVLNKQIKNGLKDWDLLSQDDKNALIKTATEIGVILGALALLSLMGYSGDDRNKKKKLQNYSWLELNTLYQLDRLFVETQSFVNPKAYLDYVLDLQIKTALEKWYLLLTDILNQEEYQSSLKSSSGNYIYKKGNKKWKTQIKRATGIQQMLNFKDSPDEMLKNYDKLTRSK
jgi:hypothetical protein